MPNDMFYANPTPKPTFPAPQTTGTKTPEDCL